MLSPAVPAVVLALTTFYIQTNSFFFFSVFGSDNNLFFKVLGWVYFFPQTILYLIFGSIINSAGDGGLGLAILLELATSPVALVFWYIIFVFILWICKKFTAHRFIPYIIIGVILVALVAPIFVLSDKSSGSVTTESCLSGDLNQNLTGSNLDGGSSEFTVGPDSCLEKILFGQLGSISISKNVSSEKLINFCVELSDEKKVPAPEFPYTYFPTGATHQEFCIFTLAQSLLYRTSNSGPNHLAVDFHKKYITEIPLPEFDSKDPFSDRNLDFNTLDAAYRSKLCEVFGQLTNSPEKKERCNSFFYEEKKFSLEKRLGRESRNPLDVEKLLTGTSTDQSIIFRKTVVTDPLVLIVIDKAKEDMAKRYGVTAADLELFESEKVFSSAKDFVLGGFSPLALSGNYTVSGNASVSGGQINFVAPPKSPASINIKNISGSDVSFDMEYLNAEKNWLSVDSGGADILGIYDINYRQPTRKTFVVSVSSVGDLSFKYFTYSTTNSALMKISNVRTGEF
ncbi:MAG: hypothetical protein AAB840_02660, partial [Patescibacteria group bacterium]